MYELKALRERGGKLNAEIQRLAKLINDDKRDFTAEERQAWDQVNKDYDALRAQVDILERAQKVQAEQLAPVGDPLAGRDDWGASARKAQGSPSQGVDVSDQHRALALQAWCRWQMGEDVSDEQSEACRIVGLNHAKRSLNLQLYGTTDVRRLQQRFRAVHPSQAQEHALDFRANMSSVTGSTGAYLIPPETLIRQLEVNMLAFGGMRQVAEVIRTATGERMGWPTADDTGNTGEQLGEGASVGSSVDPTIGKVYWDAYKFSSKLIRVPFELLEDSAFDLVNVLGAMLGERLGRITNTKFTTGNGTGAPKGLVPAAGTFAAASATAIKFDDIFGLVHKVDPAYRTGDCLFMMHDDITLELRKLKDGNGQYLWQSGLRDGQPDRILNYGLVNNQDMDKTLAAAKKTVLFGQLRKYKIRSVNGVRMYRLVERFRDNDEDGFIALVREDGNLLDAGTDPVKVLLH